MKTIILFLLFFAVSAEVPHVNLTTIVPVIQFTLPTVSTSAPSLPTVVQEPTVPRTLLPIATEETNESNTLQDTEKSLSGERAQDSIESEETQTHRMFEYSIKPTSTMPPFTFPTVKPILPFKNTFPKNPFTFPTVRPPYSKNTVPLNPFTFPTVTPSAFTFPTVATPPPMVYSTGNDLNTTFTPIQIDPESLMSVPDIITHWGYPVETHNVITKDGYILQLHRIPHGKNSTNSQMDRPVVFLQHGLLCTSSIWLLNLPHQSAGFVYADAGFDVWLGNMRGNIYSKQHVTIPATNPNFWKFSWEEMARFDLPAMINYVLKITKQKHLYYVGHSQGTLTMFAHLSARREFAHKIRKFFALAPVGRMSHVQGMFKYLGQIYEQFKLMYNLFGDGEFLSNNIFTRLFTDILCDASVKNGLCENFIFSVSGPNSNQFNTSRIGIYLAHNPAGTSSRNILHFAQMVHGKRMSSFDRGKAGNVKYYGTILPPEYNISRVAVPTYLFYSKYDWLANPKDVEGFILKRLPNSTIKLVRKLKEFNHNDFLWGLRARKEIYDPIAEIIKIDHRRLQIQNGLKSFLQSEPEHIPPKLRNEIMSHLNTSMEFDD